MKRIRWSLSHALAASGLALFFFAAGCERAENAFVPPPPPAVTVAKPLQRPVTSYFFSTGNIASVQQVELRSRVDGYLDQINFQDGDVVKAGQVLFVIEKPPYEAALAAAEAEVAKSQAQLKLADAQLARSQELISRGSATPNQLDVAKAERDSAAASVAAAQASLRQARLDLSYTDIVAPFDGKVGARQIDRGNLVQDGTTVLAEIESIDPIYVTFFVSESALHEFGQLFQKDGKARPEEEMPPIEVSIVEGDDYPYSGKFDFSAFGVDPNTGTNLTRAILSNANQSLSPGLFVRVRVPMGDPEQKLLVEERAISTDQRGDYVLVVNEKNIVEYRPVELGTVDSGMRVIEQGLKPDETIVINGLQSARPGSEVNPELGEMEPLDTGVPTAFLIGPASDEGDDREVAKQPARGIGFGNRKAVDDQQSASSDMSDDNASPSTVSDAGSGQEETKRDGTSLVQRKSSQAAEKE